MGTGRNTRICNNHLSDIALASDISTMLVTLADNLILIKFQYDPRLVPVMRGLPGREWHSKLGAWSIPLDPIAGVSLSLLERAGFRIQPSVLQAVQNAVKKAETVQSKIDSATFDTSLPLLDYQKKGATFLWENKGGILAFDVGLGKTITAMAVMSQINRVVSKPRFLIICPSILKTQWADEIQRFSPELLYYSTITNYEQVRAHPDKYLGPLWDGIIMDEAHKMGNPQSQQSKVCRQLRGRYKICLTGTPISNHPHELWALLSWLDPAAFGSYHAFVNRYCTFNPWGGVAGTAHLDELAMRIKPYLLKVGKEVLAELKPIEETEVEFELSDEETELYNQVRMGLLLEIEKSLINKVNAVTMQSNLIKALRLQQLTASMELIGTGQGMSTKTRRVVEIIEKASTKVVVYTRFSAYADVLERDLAQFGVLKLSGKVKTAKRQEIIQLFNQDNHHRVLIITDAASHGVNLQYQASVQILCEVPFSLGKKTQVMGRIHRFGQKQQVRVIYLLAQVRGKRSIDHHIKNISIRKADVARRVLTPSELKELLT